MSHIYTTGKNKGQIKNELLIEGFDEVLLGKLKTVEGSLNFADESNAIALVCEQDDYGNPIIPPGFPEIGEDVIIDYIREVEYYDSRTGEPVNAGTPDEFISMIEKDIKSAAYKALSVALAIIVCAFIHKPLIDMLSNIFWFFEGRMVLLPLLCAIPVLYLIGIIVPSALYKNIKKTGIIERIRE